VIVSVVHRVDSLAVHCLFTRSHSDKLSSLRILREDQVTQLARCVTKACAYQVGGTNRSRIAALNLSHVSGCKQRLDNSFQQIIAESLNSLVDYLT
jgi:hypothetical protein